MQDEVGGLGCPESLVHRAGKPGDSSWLMSELTSRSVSLFLLECGAL